MSPSTRLSLSLGVALLVGVSCRDDNNAGLTDPDVPPSQSTINATITPLTFTQVSVGPYHSCGLTTNTLAYCWGFNYAGQLGDGTKSDRFRPVAVLGGRAFRAVSAGADHSCGVTADYKVYCWGGNGNGHLGDGTTTDRLMPVRVLGEHSFRQLSAGWGYTCGVTVGHHAFCWGYNGWGQRGNGKTDTRLTPGPVAGGLRFLQISAKEAHTCGVTTENRAYCWGLNDNAQLGDGTTTDRLIPVRVTGGRLFRQVSAGNRTHSCGVTLEYRAYCWGWNPVGQLGTGDETGSVQVTPVPVSGGLRFRQVSAAVHHTCGVTTGSLAYCWGYDDTGALGAGASSVWNVTPVAVFGGLYWKELGAGVDHTCGRTSAGKAYCWGDNQLGAVGDGTTTMRFQPRAVVGPM